MPSGFFYRYPLDRSISNRSVWLVFIITMFYKIPVFNANSVDPDPTPRSAASDLGLHYLPMSHLWDARLKWVKHNCPAHTGLPVVDGLALSPSPLKLMINKLIQEKKQKF